MRHLLSQAAEMASPGSPSFDHHVVRWQGWVRQIEDDVFNLWFDDNRYHQLQEIAPGEAHEDFIGWVGGVVLDSLALGVRRQADLRTDCITLARLASDVAEQPNAFLSAPWFIALLPSIPNDLESVSAGDIQRTATEDLQSLRELSEGTRQAVNKTLAHWSTPAERTAVSLHLREVRNVTAHLRGMLNRYRFALTGSMALAGPVPEYDWLEALVMPWISSEDLRRYAER